MLVNQRASFAVAICILVCILIVIGAIFLIPSEQLEIADNATDTVQSASPSPLRVSSNPPHGRSPVHKTRQPLYKESAEPPGRLSKVEKHLSQLSLKELIPHLERMTPSDVRQLGENADWFKQLLQDERNLLSTEEYIAMETLHRRAYGGKIESEYEAFFGYPMPPPGYVSVRTEDGSRHVIEINKPYVRVKYSQTEGYEKWDNLSSAEWKEYQLLNTIVSGDKALWEAWDVDVSASVVAHAKSLRQPLYEKSWGTHNTPIVSVISHYTRDKTASDQALEDDLVRDKHLELDAQTGQSSRQSSGHDYAFHRDDVLTLIREIEASLK